MKHPLCEKMADMKEKKALRFVFLALSVICGLGAVISNFTNDIGVAWLTLLPLAGFFAWFALREEGWILVTIISVAVNVICQGYVAWWEWLMILPGSIITTVILGMIGFAVAFLFYVGFSKDFSDVKHIRILRPLSAVGAVLVTVMTVNLIMVFTGNPIVYLQARSAADAYVEQQYPDEGYELLDSEYNFELGVYNYYYKRSDVGMQPIYEVSCSVDNDYPVIRYFSSYTVEGAFSSNEMI